MLVKDLTQAPFEQQQNHDMISSTSTRFRIVTKEFLDELYKTLSPNCGGRREDYFAVAFIARRFNVDPARVLSNVALGGTEFGIDAFYHDKMQSTMHIMAFSWSDDHMSLKAPLEKFGKKGIDKIFVDIMKSPDDPPMITYLRSELFDNRRTINKVVISFIFNGDPVDAEQSKVLSFLRETIEDRRGTIADYFFRIGDPDAQCDVIFQYVSNQRSLGHSSSSRKTMEYTAELDQSLRISGGDGGKNEMLVALVPLSTLHQMYSDLGERFFEKNIRSGLDDGSMTNDHIKESIKSVIVGEEPAENFAMYHNGITLTAQQLETNGNQVRFVEPRILNGAQTIKIVKGFVDEHNKRRNKKAASADHTNVTSVYEGLAKIKLMARIIKSSDNDFLRKVTISNNRQNPIMPWNLRANDLVQIGFEELFAKIGVYYERRENAYKNLTDEDLETVGVEKGVIEIRKFAQTLLAMQGQIDRISEIKEVFENQAWYSNTFKERYLEIDPRKFVLLYKVQFRLPTLIREMRNIGNDKYNYVSKAKNLLWCLSLQGLMNDSKFAKYAEQYGTSTGIEATITDILKSMARLRLGAILSDALEAKKYESSIKEGKVSALKTKSLFNNCMVAAKTRFGWEKMYL